MALKLATVDSPLGDFHLVLDDDTLVNLALPGRRTAFDERFAKRYPGAAPGKARGTETPVRRIRAYFGGDLDAIDAIDVDAGGTPFQESVWKALRRVKAGRTVAYSELAAKIGKPKAVRAVAAANATNPIALVVPCHRVVAKDGSLWGYGGGLPMKEWLLTFEGARLL